MFFRLRVDSQFVQGGTVYWGDKSRNELSSARRPVHQYAQTVDAAGPVHGAFLSR